eukprot:IDg13258t1
MCGGFLVLDLLVFCLLLWVCGDSCITWWVVSASLDLACIYDLGTHSGTRVGHVRTNGGSRIIFNARSPPFWGLGAEPPCMCATHARAVERVLSALARVLATLLAGALLRSS